MDEIFAPEAMEETGFDEMFDEFNNQQEEEKKGDEGF
jgi:hypothetical protein